MQYQILKANFHTHTSEQAGIHLYPHYDGFYYRDLIDKFAEENYDFLAITEHHADSSKESFTEGKKYIKDRGYSLILLSGYEHKFEDKHEELLLDIAGQQIHMLCHPFRYKGVDPYWRIKKSKEQGCQFVEIGKQLETRPEELKQLCDYLHEENLIPIANSDLHGDYFYIYRQYTLVIASNKSEAALKTALLLGNTVAYYLVNEKVKLISGGGSLAEQWLAGENKTTFDKQAEEFKTEHYSKGNYAFNWLNQMTFVDGAGEMNLNAKTFLTFANEHLQLVFDQRRCGRIVALQHKQSDSNVTSYYSGLFKDLVYGEFISEFSEGTYEYEVIAGSAYTEILFKSCKSFRYPDIYIEKRYILKNYSGDFEVEYCILSRQDEVPFRCWIHSSIEKDSNLTKLVYFDKRGKRLTQQFGTKIATNKVSKVVFENDRQQLSFAIESNAKASFVSYNGLKECSCEIIFDEIILSPQSPLKFKIKTSFERG